MLSLLQCNYACHCRWLDKAVNFVFHANGRACANVEHTCLDATVSWDPNVLSLRSNVFVTLGNCSGLGVYWRHGGI